MRLCGVALMRLKESDLFLLPLFGVGGAWFGALIQGHTHGSVAPVAGLAAAAMAAGALSLAGATEAGWRGAGLCVAGGALAFLVGTLAAAVALLG